MKRTLPFWSWNGELDECELRHQIHEMHSQGIGGFFMHARSGLKTPYMSDKWLSAIQACIEEARKLDMQAYVYDEEGWPSGAGGGQVISTDSSFKLSWLEFTKEKVAGEFDDDPNLMYRENDSEGSTLVIRTLSSLQYVDILNPDAVKAFINLTHEKYHTGLPLPTVGFFTDEPQFAKGKIPWSSEVEKEFIRRHGFSLANNVHALFCTTLDSPRIRYQFWTLIHDMFCKSFLSQIGTWCKERGYTFTGHLLREETLLGQMQSSAGVMDAYRYFEMPGMDWLGREIGNPITPVQLCSVAEQLGKREVISESFALSGWNVSFRELKWLTDWQFIYGVNTICQHLQSYTLSGFCKRDYPPSLFFQQSWWPEYKQFNDYIQSRGDILSNKKHMVSVLVLHPMHSAYLVYDGTNTVNLQILERDFASLTCFLDDHHIEHHYGDESIIRDFGHIEDGLFVVGECHYATVILPSMYCIDKSTLSLLMKFAGQGGKIFSTGIFPEYLEGERGIFLLDELKSKVTCIPQEMLLSELHANVTICDIHGRSIPSIKVRTYDSCVFLLNTDKALGHEVLIHWDNEDFQISLQPMESLLVSKKLAIPENQNSKKKTLNLSDTWSISSCDDNMLTLDTCRWRIDNGQWMDTTPVILLMETLLRQQTPCDVEMQFQFHCTHIPDRLLLVAEDPDKCEISCNGRVIDRSDEGWWKDPCFKKTDITQYVQEGRNVLHIRRKFYQDPHVYEVLYGENVLESEKHRLTYNTQLENVYLVGSFGVYSQSSYLQLSRQAVKTDGPFILDKLPDQVSSESLVHQGFCFFSGNISLVQNLFVSLEQDFTYHLDFGPCLAPVWTVSINGIATGNSSWAPYTMDITKFLKEGDNRIEVTLFASNRNLLGPHHNKIGESYQVGPSSFTDVPGWPEQRSRFTETHLWSDSYCFVDFGIGFREE